MRKRTALLFLVVSSCFIVKAQVTTLDTVLNRIERNHLSLLAYENRIKSSEEMVNTALQWTSPMVGAGFGNDPYGSTASQNNMFMYSIEQDFPNRKRINARKDYLSSLTDVEKNDARIVKNILFTEAKQAYYGHVITERRIKVLEESIKLMNAMIDIGQKQIAIGKTELPAVYQLKAKLANTETMLVHEKNLIRMYNLKLNYLMSRESSELIAIDTSHAVKNYRVATLLSKDSLQNRRSDIRRISSVLNSMKLNQTLISLQTRPQVGIRYEQYLEQSMPNQFQLMLQMRIPFLPWVSKQYRSEVKAMSHSISAMDQEKQNSINKANQIIQGLLVELESEYSEIDNYEKKVIPANRKSLEVSLLSYGQNTNDIMIALLAWEGLRMAQMEYLRHLETLLTIQTEYEKELEIR